MQDSHHFVDPTIIPSNSSNKRKSKRMTGDSPLKKKPTLHVAPTTTAMDIPKQQPLGLSDFTGYTTNFNGYKCRFLKKEQQIMVKLNIHRMSITHFETLGLQEINESERQRLTANFDKLLQQWRDFDVRVDNPFRHKFNSEGDLQTPYIRISSDCSYFKKKLSGIVHEVKRVDRPHSGETFSGKIAILIKGIKYSQDGFELSPIMVVAQVLEHEKPKKLGPPALEVLQRVCILDEDVDNTNAAQPISLDNYLKEVSTDLADHEAMLAAAAADTDSAVEDLFN